MGYGIITLKKGEGRLLKSGGPWIFDNEIGTVTGDFENGGLVIVRDFDGYPLGRGIMSRRSTKNFSAPGYGPPGSTGKRRWTREAAG